MIRQSVLIALTLAFLVIISHASFAHSVDKNGKLYMYKAEKVDIAPTLDGTLDEQAWQGVETVALEWDILKDQPWKDAKDFEGRFAAVWRGSKLYIALWLNDDQIDANNRNPLESDSIELYVDPKHYAGESDRYQHVVLLGQKDALKDSKHITLAWSGDERFVEVAIDIGFIPNLGQVIGFDIYYNDSDSNRREHQIGWTPGDNMKDAANLGDLTFSEPKRVREKRLSTTWGSIKALY